MKNGSALFPPVLSDPSWLTRQTRVVSPRYNVRLSEGFQTGDAATPGIIRLTTTNRGRVVGCANAARARPRAQSEPRARDVHTRRDAPATRNAHRSVRRHERARPSPDERKTRIGALADALQARGRGLSASATRGDAIQPYNPTATVAIASVPRPRAMAPGASNALAGAFDKQEERQAIGNVLGGAGEERRCARPFDDERAVFSILFSRPNLSRAPIRPGGARISRARGASRVSRRGECVVGANGGGTARDLGLARARSRPRGRGDGQGKNQIRPRRSRSRISHLSSSSSSSRHLTVSSLPSLPLPHIPKRPQRAVVRELRELRPGRGRTRRAARRRVGVRRQHDDVRKDHPHAKRPGRDKK